MSDKKVKYPSAVHAGHALIGTFVAFTGLLIVGTVVFGVREAHKQTQRAWRRIREW